MINTLITLFLDALYVQLSYITFKQLRDKQSKEDVQMRVLLKWITSTIFLNCFWTVEIMLFFFPTSLIKLGVGCWIMMPQYFGEYMIFGLLAGKLE